MGYVHFEDLIGPRTWSVDVKGVRIVGMDSSEPDQNEGRSDAASLRVEFREYLYGWPTEGVRLIHHHLLSYPRDWLSLSESRPTDAGDLLEVVAGGSSGRALGPDKHVPYARCLENMYIANAGTVSYLRVRGYTKPCYNVLEFDGATVKVHRKFPFGAMAGRHGALLVDGSPVPSGVRAAVEERTVPVGE